jgi:hypothetical protein
MRLKPKELEMLNTTEIADRFVAHGASFDPVELDADAEKRRRLGMSIDPATAEVQCLCADPAGDDPYEVFSGLMFVRNPGGECVLADDLPEATWEALVPRIFKSPGPDDWVLFCELPEATQQVLLSRMK